MRRRTFLQNSAAGLGMVVVPSFLLKNVKAFSVPAAAAGTVTADNLNSSGAPCKPPWVRIETVWEPLPSAA